MDIDLNRLRLSPEAVAGLGGYVLRRNKVGLYLERCRCVCHKKDVANINHITYCCRYSNPYGVIRFEYHDIPSILDRSLR
jgi:hypothetical protein